jgi:hypothetical protein
MWHSVGRIRQFKACAPNYGVLLTFRRDSSALQIALCFECDVLAIFDGSSNDPPRVNREEDFDLIRSPLVQLAQSIFPNDPDIQSLKRER